MAGNSVVTNELQNINQASPKEMLQLLEKRMASRGKLAELAAEAHKRFIDDIEARKETLYSKYKTLLGERNQVESKVMDLDKRLGTAIVEGTKEDVERIRCERNRLNEKMQFLSEQMEVIAAYRLTGSEDLFSEMEQAYQDLETDNDQLREYVSTIQNAANEQIAAFQTVSQYYIWKETVPDVRKAEAIHENPEEFRVSLQKRLALDEMKEKARRDWIEKQMNKTRGTAQSISNEVDTQPKEIKVYRTIKDPVSGRPVRQLVNPKTGEPIEQMP